VTSTASEVPPQPLPDEDSLGFWQATAEGRLEICRCQGCRLWLQPPLERCPHCWSETAFEPVSGEGEVHSFIVVHQPAIPGYRDQLPYVVALVTLAEQAGLRLPGRLVGIPPTQAKIGQQVQAEIEPLSGGDYHVAVFRPVPDSGG
jgi:uncharacterized OB-fold protein